MIFSRRSTTVQLFFTYEFYNGYFMKMPINTGHMEKFSHQCSLYKWLRTLITWKRFLTSVVLLWILKCLFCENDSRYWSHEKRFWLVWILLCLIKSQSFVNDFGHWSHGKRFHKSIVTFDWELYQYFLSIFSENVF